MLRKLQSVVKIFTCSFRQLKLVSYVFSNSNVVTFSLEHTVSEKYWFPFFFLSKTIQPIHIFKIHFDHTLSSSILLFLDVEPELEPHSIKFPGFPRMHLDFFIHWIDLLISLPLLQEIFIKNALRFKWYVVNRCWIWKNHYMGFTGKSQIVIAWSNLYFKIT